MRGCLCILVLRDKELRPLSTTKAEYVALAAVVKEVLCLKQGCRFMLPDIGMPCMPVFEDDEGVLQLV